MIGVVKLVELLKLLSCEIAKLLICEIVELLSCGIVGVVGAVRVA